MMTPDGRIRRPPTAFTKSPKHGPRDRKENPGYLSWLRSLPCIVTETTVNVHAAHIRFSDAGANKTNPGIGKKPDDRYALPLCFELHNGDPRKSQHSMNERAFWERHGIDPIKAAERLWQIYTDTNMSTLDKRMVAEEFIHIARIRVSS